MAKPMYVWNGSAWEAVAPTVPESPISYQASAPASPSTGDIWVDSDGDVGTFDRQLVRYRFVASGGETSLSGVDANGFTLAYVPGAEQVYLNGVLLVRTSDYTATNGTSITALSPALAANDVVEVFAYNSFNLANTYTKAEVDGSLALKSDVSATGLVHINTTAIGSGVSSVSIGSDADPLFSSNYDVYFFTIINGAGSSAGTNMLARLRANVTDASGSNYVQNEIYNSASSALAFSQTTTAFKIGFGGDVGSVTKGYIFNPFATNRTFLLSSTFADSATPQLIQGRLSGEHNLSTSYNGITIFPSAGTLTGGSIRFYGVKN